MGEYVFDHAWADAYNRAGLDYYPKLQVCVTVHACDRTPPARRRRRRAARAGNTLIAGLTAWCRKIEATSIHVTFPCRADYEAMGAAGWLQRTGQQFHFVNEGYANFEAFLDSLASRKRKMIRRERRDALSGDIAIVDADGRRDPSGALAGVLRLLHGHRRAQMGPALPHPRASSSQVGRTMADRILLVMAKRERALYRRCDQLHRRRRALRAQTGVASRSNPFLHFEVCYYQAIEWAIAHGLKRVEAGAQGEHKLARRLSRRADLFRARHPGQALRPGDRRLSRARARRGGRCARRIRRARARSRSARPAGQTNE